jgi:hypothetical protein
MPKVFEKLSASKLILLGNSTHIFVNHMWEIPSDHVWAYPTDEWKMSIQRYVEAYKTKYPRRDIDFKYILNNLPHIADYPQDRYNKGEILFYLEEHIDKIIRALPPLKIGSATEKIINARDAQRREALMSNDWPI